MNNDPKIITAEERKQQQEWFNQQRMQQAREREDSRLEDRVLRYQVIAKRTGVSLANVIAADNVRALRTVANVIEGAA